MKGLNKSEKMLITVLLIMLVGYVYYQYIITPVFTKVKTVQSKIEDYDQQLMKSKLMEASNKKMTADLETLKASYDKYVKLMPKSTMSAEIMREVYSLAAVNNVTFSSLTLGDGVEYKLTTESANATPPGNNNAAASQNTEKKASAIKVMSVPVTMSIKGEYSNFTAFINSLEAGGRISNISSVNVAKQEKDIALTVTLNASMLYLQDGTEAKNNYDFNTGVYNKINPFK